MIVIVDIVVIVTTLSIVMVIMVPLLFVMIIVPSDLDKTVDSSLLVITNPSSVISEETADIVDSSLISLLTLAIAYSLYFDKSLSFILSSKSDSKAAAFSAATSGLLAAEICALRSFYSLYSASVPQVKGHGVSVSLVAEHFV